MMFSLSIWHCCALPGSLCARSTTGDILSHSLCHVPPCFPQHQRRVAGKWAEPDPKITEIKACGAGQLLALQVWSCRWILPPSTHRGDGMRGRAPELPAQPGAAAVGMGLCHTCLYQAERSPSWHPGSPCTQQLPLGQTLLVPSDDLPGSWHTCSRATFRDTCTRRARRPGAPGSPEPGQGTRTRRHGTALAHLSEHLNLPALYDGAIQLLPCPVGICASFKSYKPKTL